MRQGRGRRGASRFDVTPISIFGAPYVIAWHVFSRGVSLGSGSEVAAIADQGINGNAFSQATASLRPLLAADGIDFDGTDDRMAAATNASLDSGTAFTLGIRIKPDVATSNRVPIARSQSASGSWSVQTNGAGIRFHFGVPGAAFGEVAAMLSAGVERTFVWVYDGGGATNADRLKMWRDGVSQTISFTGTIPATITNTANDLTWGSFANAVQFFDGKIKGTVCVNRVATDAQRAQLETYLGGL